MKDRPILFPIQAAMAALMALNEHDRGLVLCWFCKICCAHIGPGKAHGDGDECFSCWADRRRLLEEEA